MPLALRSRGLAPLLDLADELIRFLEQMRQRLVPEILAIASIASYPTALHLRLQMRHQAHCESAASVEQPPTLSFPSVASCRYC